jgi:uncharacterized protein Usg
MYSSSTLPNGQEVQFTFTESTGAAGTTEGFVYLRIEDFRTQVMRYVWVEDMILAPGCPLFNTRASFFEYLKLNRIWGALLVEEDGGTYVIPDYDIPGTDAIPLTFSQVVDQVQIYPFRYTSEA